MTRTEGEARVHRHVLACVFEFVSIVQKPTLLDVKSFGVGESSDIAKRMSSGRRPKD